MPRPPRQERPAEGSREVIEQELKRTAQRDHSRKDQEEKLDQAVEFSFPASDPPLAGRPTGTEHASQPTDREAPAVSKDDLERASAGRTTARAAGKNDAGMAPGDDAPAGTPSTGEDICPACQGRGQLEGRTCPNCAGRGTIIEAIGGA